MNRAKQARIELQYALDALGDGSGHESWGPGPVATKLWLRANNWASGALQASHAFELATMAIVNGGLSQPNADGGVNAERFIHCIKALAPVILELHLEQVQDPDAG